MRLHFSNFLHEGKKKLHKNDTVGEHNNKIASKNEIYSVSHYVTQILCIVPMVHSPNRFCWSYTLIESQQLKCRQTLYIKLLASLKCCKLLTSTCKNLNAVGMKGSNYLWKMTYSLMQHATVQIGPFLFFSEKICILITCIRL